MKISFEDVRSRQGAQSFLAYTFEVPRFKFHYHYHPEYELTFITEGKGERMVGNVCQSFEEGDLVLLGKSVPHTWASQEKGSAIVIQFSEALVQSLAHWQESKALKTLLSKAEKGLFFPKSEAIATQMQTLLGLEGLKKILALFHLLDDLAYLPAETISPASDFIWSNKTETRINIVCQFIQNNYHQKIDLQQIASLVHLSESAFCKFFKKATQRTFSEYVNFVRIQAVCKSLSETDKTVAEIAYENGFENVAYFNRVFRQVKQCSPKQFRFQKL